MSPLQDRSSAAVIPAIEANLSVLWRSYSRLPGAELCDQPRLFWVATDIPFPPFNGVVRARLRPSTIAPYCRIAIYLWPGQATSADSAVAD
jgi:hypothetical protein